ncbi:serine hydrolase [Cyanobium sp. NS01]|uniref:serine hydrolase domain-containing protein n=1 Tax=Cyanobium sp. NS01 TaxID=261284 RepID=UPI001CA3C27D|nr:serine hydrolase domain-containing protein [Cyanobium sp. NS01]
MRVTTDGREVVTGAGGESTTGVPASPVMHFRNGAVAISSLATLLLQLVDDNRVSLDDKHSAWLPSIPNADRVTHGQLARMTSGYRHYLIGNDAFIENQLTDPFRQITTQEKLSYANLHELLYEPRANSNYAHTNYVLLGLALERITGQSLPALIQDRIYAPLSLHNTGAYSNAAASIFHAIGAHLVPDEPLPLRLPKP